MSSGFDFKFDASNLLRGLEKFESKSDAAFSAYAQTSALKLQNYAKKHRKWTDRTGHARQRLTRKSYPVSTGYELSLSHGVDYGIWLELAHEKRFAIIDPTINYVGSQEIMPGFQRLLERMSDT